jgi:hypothetical protein
MSTNQAAEVFLDEFEQFGPTLAARAEELADDPDVAEVVSTYGGSLETASSTAAEEFRLQFREMGTRRQEEINRTVTQAGGQQLAQRGNEVVAGTTTVRGLGAVSTIVEKLKWLLRELFDISGFLETVLQWIDKIIDNVVGLFQSG